jgi:hypothetical protein
VLEENTDSTEEQPILTTTKYPNDYDTTCLALTTLGCSASVAHSVMDMAVKNVNADGIVQVCPPCRDETSAMLEKHIC